MASGVRDFPPSIITTADNFYDRANKLRDRLVTARKKRLGSGIYHRALRSLLNGLYEVVGHPVHWVYQNNHESGGAQHQSSVFFPYMRWNLMMVSSDTSPTCTSLHMPRHFSALIESRKPRLPILEWPSLLLVARLDESLPGGLWRVGDDTGSRFLVTGDNPYRGRWDINFGIGGSPGS